MGNLRVTTLHEEGHATPAFRCTGAGGPLRVLSGPRRLVGVGRRRRWVHDGRGGGADAGSSEDLATLLGELVLAEHLVAGRDDLGDRREVALAPGERVAGRGPHHAEEPAPQRRDEQQSEGAHRLAEEGEDEADEDTEPYAREEATQQDPTPREPRGDALDLLEVGADDEDVLDRELLVGQGVDGPLGVFVLLVDAERDGVVEG